MLFELMSDGKLAQLPPENIPDGISMPTGDLAGNTRPLADESSVVVLLPHNKYLLGTSEGKREPRWRWIYGRSPAGNDQPPADVYLYEDEDISLINEGTRPTVIPADTVNILRKELFSLTEPPGHHEPTALMLRTIMPDHPVFNNDKFMDEKFFSDFMKADLILYKAYWTLRFSLARGELETIGRLKAWLNARPEIFEKSRNFMKIWFSLLDVPEEHVLDELVEMKFSRLELQHIAEQQASPVVVYNPLAGWLLIGQFGRSSAGKINTMFRAWMFLSHELYHELKYMNKMETRDIIMAVWGEHETRQAIQERAKYKGVEDFYL